MVPNKIKIEKQRIILVEGMDEKRFFISAYKKYSSDEIQVEDFGGVDNLTNTLGFILNDPNFHNLKSMVIARDAEKNADSAIQSIQSSLRECKLPTPSAPFEYTSNSSYPLKVAFMIFPGFETKRDGNIAYSPGTLEDLCISLLPNIELMRCVEGFLDCAKNAASPITHNHKAKFHAYLAGLEGFAGLKLGEAADRNAWNWDHELLTPYKRIIEQM